MKKQKKNESKSWDGRGDGTTSGQIGQSCPSRNALKKGMVLKTDTNARENTCAIPMHHARGLPSGGACERLGLRANVAQRLILDQ